MSRHASEPDASVAELLAPLLAQIKPLGGRALQLFASTAPAPAPVVVPKRASDDGRGETADLGWFGIRIERSLLEKSLRFLAAGFSRTGKIRGTYEGELQHTESEFLMSLGHDFRKYGLEPEHYISLSQAIVQAIEEVIVPSADVLATYRDAVELTCHLLALGAQESSDVATTVATVVDIVPAFEGHLFDCPCTKHCIRGDHDGDRAPITIVRVQTDPPRPWWAGQYVDVSTPYTPDMWRYLSPAIPFNPDGLAEFHIRAVGDFSRAIVNEVQVGDQWAVANNYGQMQVDVASGKPVVMIAGSTGLAPLRALILDMSLLPNPPQVTLYFGAYAVDELYDIVGMHGFASAWSWLTVVPVVEHLPTQEELDALEVPAEAWVDLRGGLVGHVAADDGAWKGAQVLVAGNPRMIRSTVSELVDRGADREDIQFDWS